MQQASASFPARSVDTVPVPARSSRTVPLWLIVLGVVAFLTFDYGGRGLNEPDEGRYSNIALEFLEPGADWLEPKMSDFSHYDKPPLTYWLTALSLKLLGQNEYAARLPCLIGALLTLAGVGWTALRLYDREIARWAVLICGTLAHVWFLARFLTPDMLLTGFCTLAVASWAESRHRQSHIGYWLLSLFFWCLAWWTKATPALIPLLGLAAACWLLRDSPGKGSLRPLKLLAGILLLGSPWFLLMVERHPDLSQFFFHRELIGRITGHVDGRRGNPFYYVLLSLVTLLPWWPLLLVNWRRTRPHAMTGGLRSLPGLLGVEGIIFVVGLITFSALSSKLPTYTVLLAPWAALLFARCLLAQKRRLPERSFNRDIATTLPVYGALVVVGVIVYPRFETRLRWNSSMRPVARALKTHGAEAVYLDRYWPGIEFYFGENVHFVLSQSPRERSDDPGICSVIGGTHFISREEWVKNLKANLSTNIWLVSYRPAYDSPFARAIHGEMVRETISIGDFLLARVK